MSLFRRRLLIQNALKQQGGGGELPSGLIAQYECYDKTNSDTDKDVLVDLTGNGHNITLFDFPFDENEGYGSRGYKGALYRTGGFGTCNNFPTMKNGFSVCVIRKWVRNLGNNTALISKSPSSYQGEFVMEYATSSGLGNRIFGDSTGVFPYENEFSYLSRYYYNGRKFAIGIANYFNNRLDLFGLRKGNHNLSHIALYAIDIFNRSLSLDEFATVKEIMMARYYQKTQ